MGMKCLETAAYGACKRIEIFSSSLLESTDNTDEGESVQKVNRNPKHTHEIFEAIFFLFR